MALFDSIRGPEDLRRLDAEELTQLAEEMRVELIETITRTGGHLGSGLGVLELTLALHSLYDFSHDRLVFDVGHQCYPHKMLTGRRHRMDTMRKDEGLCGFPHPDESEFDQFHTGHAGTSISLALGLALADKQAGNGRRTVAVVGDASYGAGVAFEAMNSAHELGVDLLVILNDNEMSISPTVGALSRYFTRVRMGPLYSGAKREMHELIKHIPFIGEKVDRTVQESLGIMRSVLTPGHMFEEYGFEYFGPMEGHDMPRLLHTLTDLQERGGLNLLHLLTDKGAGHADREDDPQRLHGVKPAPAKPADAPHIRSSDGEADPPMGQPPMKRPPYTNVFANKLVELARSDKSLIGITAAMPDGTGLVKLAAELPDRCEDVGICEQHAVALAGGLAKGGCRPVVAIYSTFLQRAYDQVFQELVIQNASCVLAMDRAGLVDDGATHHGLFDIAYLRTLPNTVLMAPGSAEELEAMLAYAIELPGVVGLRYPRDAAPAASAEVPLIELGKAVTLREGGDVVLAAYGTMVALAEAAADLLAAEGLPVTVINARFAKPVDVDTLGRAAEDARLLVTLEEHSLAGGFGSAVLEAFSATGRCLPPVLRIGVPDHFVEHGTRARLLEKLGFTPEGLAERIRKAARSPLEGALAGL
jgi:1-deoxy-D-xylulose-5-phosphate synthase